MGARLIRLFRRTERLWLPLLSVVVTLAVLEGIAWLVPMGEGVDADFAFLIRQVDGDVEESYNVEDPYLMWRPEPGYDDGLYRINARGLRDGEVAAEPAPGKLRIVALGDSSTFGYGVALEDTYHSQLERLLEGQGIGAEVINAGVTGYTSAQGLAWFNDSGASLQPDIVTVYFGPNDIKEAGVSDAEVLASGGPEMVRAAKRHVLLRLRSYRLIRRMVAWVRGWIAEERPPRPRVSETELRANLQALHAATRAIGASLVAISPPVTPQRALPELVRYRAVLEETAARLGIPVVRIPEMTEQAPNDASALFLDTYHPSPAGHALIARRLLELLQRHDLLAR